MIHQSILYVDPDMNKYENKQKIMNNCKSILKYSVEKSRHALGIYIFITT